MTRTFQWAVGAPETGQAFLLTALSVTRAIGWRLTVGPVHRDSGAPWRDVTVTVGLYRGPHDDAPLHSTLAGLASSHTPGYFTRPFFSEDLRRHLVPLADQTVYACADGPGWRFAQPVRVMGGLR